MVRVVIRHELFRSGRRDGLLLLRRKRAGSRKQQSKHLYCGVAAHSSLPCLHAFFTTSSMLVPNSFSIAAAALRPGKPVIEPPGAVHAPV